MRPKVKLENHREVYEFYDNYRPHQRTSRMLHGALATAFKPTITYLDNAQEAIEETFKSGRAVVLASNHVKAIDPCVIASMPMHDETFKPLLGSTFIPSKESIQSKPGLRHIVDGLGAIPVFRENRLKDPTDIQAKALLAGAARNLMKTSISRMNSGQSMAIFPEGTRNIENPRNILKLKKGIGLMVCKVTDVMQPAIVPMAINYESGMRTPILAIGEPSNDPFARGRGVMDWLPERLQDCVDATYQKLEIND